MGTRLRIQPRAAIVIFRAAIVDLKPVHPADAAPSPWEHFIACGRLMAFAINGPPPASQTLLKGTQATAFRLMLGNGIAEERLVS
jgi:hypothetical protein